MSETDSPASRGEEQVTVPPLARRVEELEAALQPFAALADVAAEKRHPPASTCEWRIRAEDLYRAAALLKEGER